MESRKGSGRERYLPVFNAGSSSLKFEVFLAEVPPRSRISGSVTGIGRDGPLLRMGTAGEETLPAGSSARDAAARVLERFRRGIDGVRLDPDNVVASGHRMVHGGEEFSQPVRVTASVHERLAVLSSLAPLHNPPALDVMDAARDCFPDVPLVAVFDTAFFHDLPESVRSYAVPGEWRERHGIRRYGFHGLAHQHMARRLGAVVRTPGALGRVISLHLGNGCSAAALRDGRPVETSMGFTPLEGLVMGTRCGDLDPGVVLQLAAAGSSFREIDDALNRQSGLLGLSGVSGDVRELLELETCGHAGARLALAAFHHRLHKYLGAYAAVLGGVDAVTFGGGIGEHSAAIRARTCAGLGWLGLELDDRANADCTGRPGRISSEASAIEVHVIPVEEEAIIAEAAMAVIDLPAPVAPDQPRSDS